MWSLKGLLGLTRLLDIFFINTHAILKLIHQSKITPNAFIVEVGILAEPRKFFVFLLFYFVCICDPNK